MSSGAQWGSGLNRVVTAKIPQVWKSTLSELCDPKTWGLGRWGSHRVSCELGRQPLYFFQGTGLKIKKRSVLLCFFFTFKNILCKTLIKYPHYTRLKKTTVFANASLTSNSIVLNILSPPQSLRWYVFKLHVHLPSKKLENWAKICHWDMSVSKDRKDWERSPNLKLGTKDWLNIFRVYLTKCLIKLQLISAK